MANIIKEQRIIDSSKRTLAKYVLVSSGSQDSNTVLLDVSTLSNSLNANGKIMTTGQDPKPTYRTTVKRVFGQVASAAGRVYLNWHGDANTTMVAVGPGSFDFQFMSMGDGATIPNPEANTSGDILITTVGLSSGDVATIFLDVKKDARDYDAGQTADPYAFNRRPL